ncbi:MAG: TldD/PmbA family protein [Candidatus Latescibacteria bacterium]|nr:TldD/PmbA family protein [Candidatus Latescibacterota bacterium]
MIEKILDKVSRNVDSAEVFAVETSNMDVTFESGKLKNAEYKGISGIALRVIKNGRIGFSSSTDPERFNEMVEHACASSKFGKKVEFEFPCQLPAEEIITFDPAIESFTPQKAVEEGQKAVHELLGSVPKGLTDVHISASTGNVRIANTSGLDISYRVSGFDHAVTSVIIDGDSILWIGDGGSYGTLDIRTDEYIKKISGLAKMAKKKAPRSSGKMPVIFTAQEMPNILQSIELGVDGKRLLKGDSPLIGREGENILGRITITDDPFKKGAPASRPYDDEGVPSRRNVLFENGQFKSFLFDLDTAQKTGNVTTASAERGSLSTPSIGISNLVMSPGNSSLDEMIADIAEGVIVYGVLGGGQSNLLAGDFALNIMLGFLVSGGEIKGRLIDTMVSGNVYSAFKSVVSMGSQLHEVGSLFIPDVLFPELSISGR